MSSTAIIWALAALLAAACVADDAPENGPTTSPSPQATSAVPTADPEGALRRLCDASRGSSLLGMAGQLDRLDDASGLAGLLSELDLLELDLEAAPLGADALALRDSAYSALAIARAAGSTQAQGEQALRAASGMLRELAASVCPPPDA